MSREMWEDWSPDTTGDRTAEHRCLNCGAHVSPDFLRVFGDNENVVEGCVECMTVRRLTSGPGQ